MKIIKQTPTSLIIKANPKTAQLAFGMLLLIIGLFVLSFVRIQTLPTSELLFPRFSEPSVAAPSASEVSVRLAYSVGKWSTHGRRPFVALAILGIIVGSIIVLGPNRSQTLIFDKSNQQLTIKKPRHFFRSKVERYDLTDISDIRVERDQSSKGQGYGVTVVVSHSEGIPLNRNYIHYKKVFPLSRAYKYKQQQAKEMAQRIESFLS